MTTGQRHEEITGSIEPTNGQFLTLLSEFKAYAVIEHNLDDAKLLTLLRASIVAFERYTKHPLYFKRIAVYVTSVSGRLDLPLLPCKDFEVTINNAISLDFKVCGKGCVSLISEKEVIVRYTAGFSFEAFLSSISLSYIKTGIFEYAKMLNFAEYEGVEDDLVAIMANRFISLRMDAYCTSLL